MKPRLAVFLFIDALGWDVVSHYHFMEDALPERRAAAMQFGYSCSAIPTILSGRTPAEHGHLSLFNYAPGRSPFRIWRWLHWLFRPRSFWDRGRVRGVLSRIVKKIHGFSGYFQLYRVPLAHLPLLDYGEKKDLFVPGGLAPFPNLADTLRSRGLAYHISDWRLPEEENLRRARQIIAAESADFLFIYTAAFDALRHAYDYASPEGDALIRSKLAFYEQEIRELLKVCREHAAEFNFTVLSDHGMTPLTHTADMQKILASTGLQFNVDYAACLDSTMLRVYFLQAGAREKITAAVNDAACPGHWLSEDEEKKYGIYRTDRQFGDAIFLTDPGVQIAPSDMGQNALPGMHGFAPDDAHSAAAILSTTPIPAEIRTVADFFSLMQSRAASLTEK